MAGKLPVRNFAQWVEEVAEGKEYVTFKLLNGDSIPLFGQLFFGDDFVAGNATHDPSAGRTAVRYDAIASIYGGRESVQGFDRQL